MREPVEIVAEALAYNPVAVYVGYSGGDDSLATAHWCMTNIPGCKVFHMNTGIGVERTRAHVRKTCADFDWPLVEIRAKEDCGQDYDALVLAHGFPGPAHHRKMYQRLKQRGIRELCRRSKKRYTREKIAIFTGIRQDESLRRMGYGNRVVNLEEAVVWGNPLYWWTKTDCMRYIAKHNLPRNPVSVELGMSGECLCGAFAHPGELSLIKIVCPETHHRIVKLQELVMQRHPWGWEDRPPRKVRAVEPSGQMQFMPFCVGCEKVNSIEPGNRTGEGK